MGVYVIGNEDVCEKGPNYFVYLTSSYTSLLSHLRDANHPTASNTATVRMNYCIPYQELSRNFNNSFPYSVSGHIISSQYIFDGNTVSYEAGTFIELNNGFHSGTDFVAEINPCIITRTVIG